MSITPVTLKSGQKRYRVRRGYNGKQVTFDSKREALAYLNGKKARKLLNRPHFGNGWKGYVVPTPLLKQTILANTKELRRTDNGNDHTNPDDFGWKKDLCERIASIRNSTVEAALRRLYDVTSDYSNVTTADFADAACLALGLFIDHDTSIPTLPGNRQAAKEMLLIAAEEQGIELDHKELTQLASKVHRIALLIVHYPHNADRLRKLAPLGCLGGAE